MVFGTRTFLAALLLLCSGVARPVWAGDELTVKVASFLDAQNRSPTPVLFEREFISPEDAKAIPGIASDCLLHTEAVKVLTAENDGARFTITVTATSFKRQVFMTAQATDATGVLVALQTGYFYPDRVAKKTCSNLIRPLANKLLHPVAAKPGDAESLQALVEAIGYVNTGFYETGFVPLYRILEDDPRNADALFWLVRAFAQSDHLDVARLHARAFVAAFPDDPRRSEVEDLVGKQPAHPTDK